MQDIDKNHDDENGLCTLRSLLSKDTSYEDSMLMAMMMK